MENMRFKVGDRVKVKSLQWYNENSDDNHNVVFADSWHFTEPMSNFCGKELIIERISNAVNPSYYMMRVHPLLITRSSSLNGLKITVNGKKYRIKFDILETIINFALWK